MPFPHRTRLAAALAAVTVPTLLLALAGCGIRIPGHTDGQGPLSIPDAGLVRIVSVPIGDKTPDALHWKWSLIAGSNWTTPTAATTDKAVTLALTQPYALNDPNHQHGTNVWECDLTAQRSSATPNSLQWSAILHGSNGQTAHSEGTLPLSSSDIDSAIKIEADRDTVEKLPGEVSLARIGDRELTLSLTSSAR